MKYLFETHAHTSQVSPCSLVEASDVVKEYSDKGYAGIIITDHVGKWSFERLKCPWEKKIDLLIGAYEIAKKTGDELGIKVLFGIEICLGINHRDYLAYGVDYDFLYKHKDVYKMELEDFFPLAQENDILLLGAHPFRYQNHTPNASLMHGVEVFNGNPRHNSNNNKAKKWAESNDLIQLSGSDFHEYGDVSAGVMLPSIPETTKEFVELIRSGDYELVP